MPMLFGAGNLALNHVRSLAQQGDHLAGVIMSLLNNTYYVAMSIGAEASNVIRLSGQVTDQDGNAVAGVKNIVLTSIPVSGAGTMAAVGSNGTVVAGGGTKVAWVQTLADGSFKVDVTNAAAEVNMVMADLDNGTTEQIVLTYA